MTICDLVRTAIVAIVCFQSQHAFAEHPLLRLQADTTSGLLVIPVVVDSTQCNFILDSGSTHHVFDLSLQSHLGSRVGRTRSAGASLQVHRPPSQFSIGTVDLRPAADVVLAADLTALREVIGSDITGILGAPLFKHHIVRLQQDPRVLDLYGSEAQIDDLGQCVTLESDAAGRPFIHAAIGVSATSGKLLIDTGNTSELTVDDNLFNALTECGDIEVVASGSISGIANSRPTLFGRLEVVRIGQVENRQILAQTARIGSIGLGYLSRFDATIDVPGRKLFLKPSRRFNSVIEADMSGLRLLARGGRVLVDEVIAGSPASSAGVIAGDVLQSVDGRAIAPDSLGELREYLKRGDGTMVQMVFNRDSGRANLSLILRRQPWGERTLPKTRP